jgi:hypothetical protein
MSSDASAAVTSRIEAAVGPTGAAGGIGFDAAVVGGAASAVVAGCVGGSEAHARHHTANNHRA